MFHLKGDTGTAPASLAPPAPPAWWTRGSWQRRRISFALTVLGRELRQRVWNMNRICYTEKRTLFHNRRSVDACLGFKNN